MDRMEALAVLHEISEVCSDSVIMNSVSLDNPTISPAPRDYQIKIKCTLDSSSKQTIDSVLKKHKLFLKESEGFVVIQSNV